MTIRFRGGLVAACIALAALAVTLAPSSQAGPAAVQSAMGNRPSEGGAAFRTEVPFDAGLDSRPVSKYARSSYVWPFASGPTYDTIVAGDAREPGVLISPVGAFRLNQVNFPSELRSGDRLSALGKQYFIVQLHPEAGTLAEVRALIEQGGGAVVDFMPVSAVVARLTPQAFAAVAGVPGVMAVEPYHPALKLAPTIGRTPLADPVKALSDVYTLDVRVFAGEDAQAVATQIVALGGSVKSVFPDTVVAELHRSKLAQLAALEPVQIVFEHVDLRPLAEETTTTVQTGSLGTNHAIPYHAAGVNGSGNGVAGTSPQILMIIDSGIQLDAGDLSNTRTDAGTAAVGHRKVVRYQSTGSFGGSGDTLGCDSPLQGGFTHGHFVAATAMGNATAVAPAYGAGWVATEPGNPNNTWKLDGVAPGAKLAAFDGQVTPQVASCADTLQDTISPGDLYSGGSTGVMGSAYTTNLAKIYNFSWGADLNDYGSNPIDIDTFIFDKGDAMVFVSAGNAGADDDSDDIPDEGTLGTPATTKNGLAIGASGNANDSSTGNGPEVRAGFSSMGPAVSGTVNRVAPQLMAPGVDIGGQGLSSEFACRGNDNDQVNPVQCDVLTGSSGTSFASPAAAGTGLLVRDYFAQGFYPTGEQVTANAVPNVSGALVKSLLIASADFMTGAKNGENYSGASPGGTGLTRRFRFNNEQGYGRIQLDNVLPLATWSASPPGLIVADGGIAGGPNSTTLTGTINAVTGATQTATFQVCNDQQELRVALSWVESQGQALANNLNLRLIAPSAKQYIGNYFTDDNNRNGVQDTGEDCADALGVASTLTQSQWSVPRCGNSPFDTANPTEAIMLSHDVVGDGIFDPTPANDNQIEVGAWTVEITSAAGGNNANQRYALAIAGGVCLGSSARFDLGSYSCNSTATVTVNELSEGGDLAPTEANVESRTRVEVLDESGTVVDTETGINFTQQSGLRFESDGIILTDVTAPESGNLVLDVQDGWSLRVTYDDVPTGSPTNDRRSFAAVNCKVALGAGAITFAQFGEDTTYLILGGCEKNARGLFEFGFPDRYMDAGEQLSYRYAYESLEGDDLNNLEVSLRCVEVDADSPVACLPSGAGCVAGNDALRTNNPPCLNNSGVPLMTILDSPKTIGLLPASAAVSSNFAIKMATDAVFADNGANGPTPTVEMLLEVQAATSGKTASGIAVSRHRLNVDEQSTLYSTDFPLGGASVTVVDRNNNEIAENPTTNLGDFLEDYRFETKTYGNLTANNRNLGIQSPWHFDNHSGGFQSGIGSVTDESTIGDVIAQWGEDKNFNGILDGTCRNNHAIVCVPVGAPPNSTDSSGVCLAQTGSNLCDHEEDRDAATGAFDQNWSTRGGCGWQSRAPSSCSGQPNKVGCYNDRDCLGRCRGTNPAGPHTNNACTSNAQCVAPETCSGFAGVCNAIQMLQGGAWHTGRIDITTLSTCMVNGTSSGQCQRYEVITTNTGQKSWFELLVTPVMEKVNQTIGGDGLPTHRIEIVDWAFNQQIDLADDNAFYTWEFDTDTSKIEPVDLVSDLSILNFGFGTFGAVTRGGNPALQDGYSVFAALGRCSVSLAPCRKPEDCKPGVQTCNQLNASVNGTVGGNRNGRAGCFFEQSTPIDADPVTPGVQNGRADLGLAGVTGGLGLVSDNDFNENGAGGTDEFVTVNGPMRNFDIFDWNGPDMRFTTLEDIYGTTGNTFQAAVGFLNFETTNSTQDPPVGYGLAIDDMVVEWREASLITDATTCTGICATMDVSQSNLFEGQTLVRITVQDASPYGPNPVVVNDCNDDGDVVDAGIDDNDCNNNTTPDVVVKATSLGESVDTLVDIGQPPGELVYLDRVAVGVYVGELVISAIYDTAGVLFVNQEGTDAPAVTLTYEDNDDGTGIKCQNDVDPAARGRVQVATTILFDTGEVAVINGIVTDNIAPSDADGFADSGETVDLALTVRNGTTTDLTSLVARLTTNDSKIDCIIDPFVSIGSLNAGAVNVTTEKFRFKVANGANRTSVTQDFSALFLITMTSDQFDALVTPAGLTLELDLNAVGGSGPTTFIEGFEGSLGTFGINNVDFGRHSEATSEGYRCQYDDPDWINANSYGETDCFLGNNPTQADNTWWTIEGPASDGGGRGFLGSSAAYWGANLGAGVFSTPPAVMEAIQSTNPINLSATLGSVPELSWKHEQFLADWHLLNAQPGRAADRGAVSLQVADGAGTGVGNWIRLEPYRNGYDTPAEDNYVSCMFDPIDDGNDEDDFFDPSDPDRRLGPSSTCFPAFSFTFNGDTDSPFSPNNLGNAEGPGLAGSAGTGTWVQPVVDLSRFRGRRVRLRFLVSAFKFGGVNVYQDAASFSLGPRDDGWFIDDVRVTNALTSPATLTADTANVVGTPCGAACTTVTAALAADPGTTLPAPGQTLELDASASTADKCLDGSLQYLFCADGNGDNLCNHLGTADTLLRSWTDNPTLVTAPSATTNYVVAVRCSTLTTCTDSQNANVTVIIPGGTAGPVYFGLLDPSLGSCVSGAKNCLWHNSTPLGISVDWVKVNFSPSTGATPISQMTNPVNFTNVCQNGGGTAPVQYGVVCGPAVGTNANPIDITAHGTPTSGNGFYFLIKKNQPLTPASVMRSNGDGQPDEPNTATWQTHTSKISDDGRDPAFGNGDKP